MRVKSTFSTRWVLLTLGAVLLVAAFIRLGIWQLDRLAQRRAYDAQLSARVSLPAVDLNRTASPDPNNLEFRTVTVTGQYDFADQVALEDQVWNGQLGVDLLTPLVIQGSDRAVLVDRGWIPVSDLHRDAWGKYDQPGSVIVSGMLRQAAQTGTALPVTGAETVRTDLWSIVSLPGIQRQVPRPLEPFYIQAAPDAGSPSLPARQPPQLDLSEGPHLGYAIEWFSFAGIVIVGYPFFLRRQLRRKKKSGEAPGITPGELVEPRAEDPEP